MLFTIPRSAVSRPAILALNEWYGNSEDDNYTTKLTHFKIVTMSPRRVMQNAMSLFMST